MTGISGKRSLWTQVLHRFGLLPSLPELRRNHAVFRKNELDRPLGSYEFVVLDTELTGLDQGRDAIVSVGAVRIRELSIVPGETLYHLVKPDIPLPRLSTMVHWITPQELEGKPDIASVLPELIDFCGDAYIVGHCVGLDMGFINRACRRCYGGAMRTPCIDTLRMAMLYQEELWESNQERYRYAISYNLNELSARYGLPLFGQHNALQDALQTAYLFLFLAKKLGRGGIGTLRNLFDAGRAWRFA